MGKVAKKNPGEIVKIHEAAGSYIKVNGVKTFVLDKGKGEVVLCIHGVPTSSFLYRKVIDSLAAQGYRGISIDLPGLGLSARPLDFDYSFPGFSNFLADALKVLKVEKVHLVVHDIGGPIGFALAAVNRDIISSLTILNTWIDVVNFEKPFVMRPFEHEVLGEAELGMITHTTWPVMFSKMGVNDSGNIPSEEIKAYVDLLKREDDGKAFLKIMRNFPNSEEFRETCYRAVNDVDYPVQAIWGKDDPALTVERYGNEIKEEAGLDKISLLPSRHFLQEEMFDEIAELIILQSKKISGK